MIGIFNNKTSKADLTLYNGEYILDSICTYGRVTEELNGEYSLDLTFLINENFPKKAYDLIENDSLIKIDEEYGTEYFRIAQVRKTKRYINVFARNITISEILTMWCEDVRPTDQNGNGAIHWIFDNAKGDNWLNVSSNISNINTAYYVNKNVYEALFTADNCFLDRWGGEIYRRGFNLSINTTIGQDRGVVIRSRKNLKGLEIETNLNELATRIYPKGFDGIIIEEKYIDSDLINNYSKVYAKEVKFEDVKVKGENVEEGYDTLEQAQKELKRRAELLFTKDKIDIISATYRVDFVELSKTEEYKNYQLLEKTFLGDLVTVIDENLNIDIKVRVIKRIYDILRKERVSTELSNKDTKQKPPSMQDIFNKLETIPDSENILSDAKKQATALINAGMKDSYVIVRQNEILIMDTKDINTASKVWRWNNGGLGFSSTGYYGEYGTAITNNGDVVADFITVGILNANLIKTGVLKSENGISLINMNDGTFDFANGNFAYDGKNLTMIGKIINILSGYGIQLDRGGLELTTKGEKVGGLRASYLPSDESINGVTLTNLKDGDYIEITTTESENFEGIVTYTPKLRITKIEHELMKNFKGIQLLENFLLINGKRFWLESNDTDKNNWHEIYNTSTGHMALFGDNGIILGYKSGNEKIKVFEIDETANNYGIQAYILKNLSLANNKIVGVSDIYKGDTTGRYMHEGWCGSFEKLAKRITDLNVIIDTGLYSFGDTANGRPTGINWGFLFCMKMNEQDAVQVLFSFSNEIYMRSTANGIGYWSPWMIKTLSVDAQTLSIESYEELKKENEELKNRLDNLESIINKINLNEV